MIPIANAVRTALDRRPSETTRRALPALHPRARRLHRPRLEVMEERLLLSQTFTVINTLDDTNPGSLRGAIGQVDADTTDTAAAPDTIAFAIPGAGVHTIAPATDLPSLTRPVIIDGYTQPGASANTLAGGDNAVLLVVLNGTTTSGGPNYGLNLIAGNSTVRGLVINGFVNDPGSASLRLGASGGNTISGNFIGTDATGTTALTSAVQLGRDLRGWIARQHHRRDDARLAQRHLR